MDFGEEEENASRKFNDHAMTQLEKAGTSGMKNM